MEKKSYVVVRGIEHPGTGHWLAPGTDITLSEPQASLLRLTGHIRQAEPAETSVNDVSVNRKSRK